MESTTKGYVILSGLALAAGGILWAASPGKGQQGGMETLQAAYDEAVAVEEGRKYTFQEMLDLPVPSSPTPSAAKAETRVQFVQVVMPVEVREVHLPAPVDIGAGMHDMTPYIQPALQQEDIARAVADEIESRQSLSDLSRF